MEKEKSLENLTDVDVYNKFQENPLTFLRVMWGLTPQPIKKIYKEKVKALIKENKLNSIRQFHFVEMTRNELIENKHISWQQWLGLIMVKKALKGGVPLRISIVSGHGVGKSTVLAWLMIWFLYCFENCNIGATANTADQLNDVLWKEIKIWLDKLPKEDQELFDFSSTYIRMVDNPQYWWARARTARKENPEALAGLHAPFMFIAVDEASGVIEEAFTKAEGSLTGDNTLVFMISNGTRSDGYFFDSHHDDKKDWQNLRLNGEESPLVEPDYIERIITKYGKESDEYRYMVEGLFPKMGVMDEKGWIPLLSKSEIRQAPYKIELINRIRLGIDPAGEGDDQSAFVGRDQFTAKTLAKEKISSSKSVALKALTFIKHFSIDEEDVIVDNLGQGANVAQDIALSDKSNVDVEAVNWGEPADDNEIYANKRAECFLRARKWVISGGMIESDMLIDELCKIKYRRNERGKIQIMKKSDMRLEMKKSPDECLIAGTKIRVLGGVKNIEDIKVGDKVITPFGFKKVINSNLVHKDVEVWKVNFSNNKYLIGTLRHKIFTNRGLLTINALHRNDTIKPYKLINLIIWKLQKIKNAFNTKGKLIGLRQMVNTISERSTMEQERKEENENYYTELFGKIISVKFLIITIFIILMEIPTITILKIWHWLIDLNIGQNIQKNYGEIQNIEENKLRTLIKQEKKQVNGINLKKQKNFIAELVSYRGKTKNSIIKYVKNAVKNIKHILKIDQSIVVESVSKEFGKKDVFNLTIKKDHCYFANDILVSNSDAFALTFYHDTGEGELSAPPPPRNNFEIDSEFYGNK